MPRILNRSSSHDLQGSVLPQPGSVLDHRFELLELVGVGGMGAVYRALDRTTQGIVAVKLLTIDKTNGLRRFRREFRAAARLVHPHVVAVYDYFHTGRPYFTMEFVDGHILTDWVDLAASPEARLARTRDALVQILETLAAIHELGLVHRDLKPDNILVTGDGQIKIADFGVVHGGASSTTITRGQVVGTLAYMAPEQLEGREVDGRTDLYSVGAILYELLTGESPFESAPMTSVAHAVLETAPPSPRSLNPSADAELSATALTLLSKRPWQRFSSARDALEVLRRSRSPEVDRRPPLLVPQFVGRDGELELIRELVRGDGQIRLLLVAGTAGLGKTRLLAEAAELARAFGYCTVEARGGRDQDMPLTAISHLLADPPQHQQPYNDQVNDEVPRRVTLERLIGHLQVQPSANGVGLLLDDLDRFDEASIQLIATLVREVVSPASPAPAIPPLLVIATYDPTTSNPALNRLLALESRLRLGATVQLKAFGLDETAAVARSVLGQSTIPAQLGQWLQQETEGNPLFVIETLRTLVDRGALWLDPTARLRCDRLQRPAPLAQGVRDLLERQIDGVSEPARAVLETAAIIGVEFDFDVLAGASGLDEDALIDHLQILLAARLLHELEDRPDVFRFVHNKARLVLQSRLSPERIRTLHLAAADAIEAAGDRVRDPVALARHYDAAERSDKAIQYMPEAAARLAAAGTHAAAAAVWARYLELVEPTRGDSLGLDLARCKLAQQLAASQQLTEARRLFLTILERPGCESAVRLIALERLVLVESRMGNLDAAVTRACEFLTQARQTGDPQILARAWHSLGIAQTNHGQCVDAERSLAQAEAQFRQLGDASSLATLLRSRGAMLLAQGRIAEGAELIQTALAQARALGNRSVEQFCVADLACVSAFEGNLDVALERCQQAMTLAAETGLNARLFMTRNCYAEVLTMVGDLELAEQLYDASLGADADTPLPTFETTAHTGRGRLLRLRGNLDQARTELARAAEVQGPCLHPVVAADHALEMSALERACGNVAPARHWARQALNLSQGNGFLWLEAHARCELAALGTRPASVRHADAAVELATRMGASLLLARALALRARHRPGSDLETAGRIVQSIASRLGGRKRMFLRTELARDILG